NVGSGHDCAQRYYVGTALRTGHGCPSVLVRSVTLTQNIGSVITTFKRCSDPTHHALRAQRSYPDRKSARQDVLHLCLSGASRVRCDRGCGTDRRSTAPPLRLTILVCSRAFQSVV